MTYHTENKGIMESAREEADELIADILEKSGIDYSAKKEEIAKTFADYLWNANYDWTLTFNDGTPKIRFLQEDEYEQHMDDDEKPNYDFNSCGYYIILEKKELNHTFKFWKEYIHHFLCFQD